MRELLRTNDQVLLSFVQALLRDAGITALLADSNMSIMEGSIGMLPRRLLVAEEHIAAARQVLQDADLGQWVKED
ncbi:MAG: DUF2007 domain-containing protein [Hyphomicrobiaceae bacterium]|nr:DUF2007 domain-containing protein [Hyphomicrobiaceae bacterium]MCC0009077.1 DUF2007 domain-containing protein [Hyphomicrobiaceae bacterium]